MYLINLYFIDVFLKTFKSVKAFLKRDFIIVLFETIFDEKNICNIFFFVFATIYIIVSLIKLSNYDFYRIIKYYKNVFVNSLFFFSIIFLSNIKILISDILDKIYLRIGNQNFSILTLTISILWIMFTLYISIYNVMAFEFLFSDIESIDLNYRLLIFKIFSSFMFLFILIAGFTIMNLDRILLTILGGSFSLGLSLSLQKVFINFVSSFIILFDKSLKLGDAININGHQGVMTQVTNRYVMLRNLDCSEILVPNEKFLSEVVQNQSLYFSKGNLRINVQISYNNDIELVLELLIRATEGIMRIIRNPIVLSYITNFTINSIDMELSFWIVDAVRGAALVKSEVNMNIIILFREFGVELSYNKKIVKLIN